ncbi:hypothetical protein F2Q69_00062431 [Brassica cretica]|uniref:Uncharacterized protein n=1 Tax=Brassica cretica TaxID=69181 RepID=A0A8S9RFE3_BRACR|nr:hypothetical protein F2Q69_00062431 [Brassica cretica]
MCIWSGWIKSYGCHSVEIVGNVQLPWMQLRGWVGYVHLEMDRSFVDAFPWMPHSNNRERSSIQDLERERDNKEGKLHKISRGRQAKDSKAVKEELQAEQRARRRQEGSSQRVRSYQRQEKKQSSSLLKVVGEGSHPRVTTRKLGEKSCIFKEGGYLQSGSLGHVSFSDWMRSRPELYCILRRLLRRNPIGALGYAAMKPSLTKIAESTDGRPHEMSVVVAHLHLEVGKYLEVKRF